MAYIGKVKLADISPNHPFAHPQVSFVPKRAISSDSSSAAPTTDPAQTPGPASPDQAATAPSATSASPSAGNLPNAPQRDQFQTQEEYEEALGFWQSRVGRIKGLVKLATSSASPPSSE